MSYKSVITSYGYDGEGVTRLDGKVVFVPYALEGEEVEISIEKSNTSFDRGVLQKVCKQSPHRIKPPCPYYQTCGGCCYQHTLYSNELEIKRKLLKTQLNKVGYEGDIEIIASPHEYGYRNKLTLFVGKDGLSLKRRGSDKLCKINKCLLVSDKINGAIGIIDTFIARQNLNENIDKVVIREEGEEYLLINFYLNKPISIHYQGLYLLLGSKSGIFETVSGKTSYKMGQEFIACKELGLDCKFSVNSFHQVNKFVGGMLYEHILSQVAGKDVINCYSGAGVLSGALALKGKRVRAIELGYFEHQDAERLKDDNNLFLLTNYKGDCGTMLKQLVLSNRPDTIIVDPPRSGLKMKVVSAIDESLAQEFIYISCDSATFVRDVSRLKNYKIKSVKIFDMFARTGEYEIVGMLRRKK